ncbi:MAG: N-acetylmuramoyl-L-alanine amidase [Thermoleophilaceae bacterium]|nr:N-acetylmuramoyl-L-alanine amidase [Thermoleophilaceae bacterium]
MIVALVAAAAAAVPSAAPAPDIDQMRIPFPEKREREMAAYSERHYGQRTAKLTGPKVIVEHFAAAGSVQAIFNTFAPDRRDPELGELPNVCSHYGIGAKGDIHQFVPLSLRCRHTVGLNHTAIGIEHVGFKDSDVIGKPEVLRASLALTNQLRCRYGIEVKNVIGHNESLSSPFHMERVARLRRQTHGDMKRSTMRVYRRELAKLDC